MVALSSWRRRYRHEFGLSLAVKTADDDDGWAGAWIGYVRILENNQNPRCSGTMINTIERAIATSDDHIFDVLHTLDELILETLRHSCNILCFFSTSTWERPPLCMKLSTY